jgi:hypothetical protein
MFYLDTIFAMQLFRYLTIFCLISEIVGCGQIYSRFKSDLSAAVASVEPSSDENLLIQSGSTRDHDQQITQHQSLINQGETTHPTSGGQNTSVTIDLDASSLLTNNERKPIPTGRDIKEFLAVPKNSSDLREQPNLENNTRVSNRFPKGINEGERVPGFAKKFEQKDASGLNREASESIKRATASVVVFEEGDLTINFANEMPSIVSPRFSSIESFQQIDGK